MVLGFEISSIHEPIDGITLQLMKVELTDAIKMWEPRITLLDALMIGSPEKFRVLSHLSYLLKSGDGQERTFSINIDRTGVSRWVG